MKSCAGVAQGIVSVLCVLFNCVLVTSAQDDSPRRVLPPVVVEPDEPPLGLSDGDFVPSSEDSLFTSPDRGSFDLGGLDSALRSGRSLFDDPRHVTIVDAEQLLLRQPVDMIDALDLVKGVLLIR